MSGKAPPDRPAFQPYWGKPAVRNERGDRGNVGIIRSPVRASILPDCRLEVPALEVVLRPALQLLDKGVQDHGPPPVRRRLCRPYAQRGVNAKTLRHVWTPALAQEEFSGLVQRAVGC